MSEEPYLADVQPGDVLYNFLEGNQRYVVSRVLKGEDYPVVVTSSGQRSRITSWGTETPREKVPYYLYAPVEVLGPKNLPPRPWRPRKGEWVWARSPGKSAAWRLVKFFQVTPSGRYLCCKQFEDIRTPYLEVAPFKGELPPRLEEEDGK